MFFFDTCLFRSSHTNSNSSRRNRRRNNNNGHRARVQAGLAFVDRPSVVVVVDMASTNRCSVQATHMSATRRPVAVEEVFVAVQVAHRNNNGRVASREALRGMTRSWTAGGET